MPRCYFHTIFSIFLALPILALSILSGASPLLATSPIFDYSLGRKLDYKKFLEAPRLTDLQIFLDLDETLISSNRIEYDDVGFHDEQLQAGLKLFSLAKTGVPGDGAAVLRPYAREFLLFCFRYFSLVRVWSAGQEHYVRYVVTHLFPKMPHFALLHFGNCFSDKVLINGIEQESLENLLRRYPAT